MTEKLKPCPFCGGEAILDWFVADVERKGAFVVCAECGCRTCCQSAAAAVERWNRRADTEVDR